MSDDEWVKVAMADDSVVVELLVRLNQAEPPPPPPEKGGGAPALPLDWTVRQRRSRQAQRLHVKKSGDSTRASPTTPLSWSGATSVSGGGADGFEESSRPPKRPDGARSKVTAASETTTTKRSRKKKTLLELKEEESLLLKERKRLKNELAALRITVDGQRATNESLKRMQVDLLLKPAMEKVNIASEEAISDHPQQMEATCEPMPSITPRSVVCNDLEAAQHQSPPNVSSRVQKEVANQESSFLLPDLNLPLEEDSGSEVLYGMS